MQNLEGSGSSDILHAHQLDDSDRSKLLFDQALELWNQYRKFWRKEDLDESIRLDREALALRPEGHPNRDNSLNNLAVSLSDRYYLNHQQEDLDERIRLNRDALAIRPEGHPNRDYSLNNLASSLNDRYHLNHQQEDLDDSIRLFRDALALRPEGHPYRDNSLNNLASSLRDRFHLNHQQEDLDDSIRLDREALALRPEGHPYRDYSLNNVANSLRDRFRLSHQQEDLDNSIRLDREALALRPEGHPNRHLSLANLAASLRDRFHLNHQQEDLDDSIRLNREALALRPEGHPYRDYYLANLATSLTDRFNQIHLLEDLDECIMLERVALELRPEGHPDHSLSLNNLAISFRIRFEQTNQLDDLEKSMKLRKSAALHPFSSSLERLKGTVDWSIVARNHDHTSALEAYDIALSLLQRTLTLSPTLQRQHDLLVGGGNYLSLALDAASYAIEKGDLKRAVEMLEQGRGLLWSQMRGFRTTIDSLAKIYPSLASRLKDITTKLDALSTTPDMQRNTLDEMLRQKRQLSEEQERIVEEIRTKPEFKDFLKAASFETLQSAAKEGPVIIINHCEYRSDVIILLDQHPPVNIRLDDEFFDDASTLCEELLSTRRQFKASSAQYDEKLNEAMQMIWDRVVSHVVRKLEEFGIAKGSRVWWCPTSILSVLPFHAAGPYKSEDGNAKYFIDDFIPSSTSTITSLLNARSGKFKRKFKVLVVGDTRLPSAEPEMETIQRYKAPADFLSGGEATRDAVFERLPLYNWVHLACHGHLDAKPFNSSFKLFGSELTLLDIVRAKVPNAEFAFLSACHSAEQTPTGAQDEVLHLAAAMQFCGFRSVIGTMWELNDTDGPEFTRIVYDRLIEKLNVGEVRCKRAAEALRDAALELRAHKGIATERWVNFVHIGA